MRDEMENKPVEAFFNIRGDNVHFRGLDIGREFEGCACPLFDRQVGTTVARYISTSRRQVYFDEKQAKSFILVFPEKQEAYKLQPMEYNGKIYYDFAGLCEWEVRIVNHERRQHGKNQDQPE